MSFTIHICSLTENPSYELQWFYWRLTNKFEIYCLTFLILPNYKFLQTAMQICLIDIFLQLLKLSNIKKSNKNWVIMHFWDGLAAKWFIFFSFIFFESLCNVGRSAFSRICASSHQKKILPSTFCLVLLTKTNIWLDRLWSPN